MFAFLKRTIVVLVGFLLISFLIWYFGPYFAFGTYQPLASVTARSIAIGVVVLCWLVAKAVKRSCTPCWLWISQRHSTSWL